MKLVRFAISDAITYGVLKKDKIICIPVLAERLNKPFPSSIELLIIKGMNETNIESMMQEASREDLEKATFTKVGLSLLAPIVQPPKIICLGLNYRDHAAEQGKNPPDEPVIFMKPRTAIIGPEENIVKPSFVKQLDYEAELAIIIGKRTKQASIDEAESSIFGYTILNDVSARDIQFKDVQWTKGKSLDTFAPTGPCITTARQIGKTSNLRIQTWVNKELRQSSITRNMVFNVSEIIHHLSRFMTLEPCDIIATGTPAGVGFAIKPVPKFLKEGDLIESEIEGIGTLRNEVAEESSHGLGSDSI
jgi:2-keto-4-pentenoate hydratase/2-oxohepta-3-ene-1,7-dioic acid hydratase in catechol pathway